MSVTESLALRMYGKSADPAAPENAGSSEFHAGYQAGQDKAAGTDSMAIIEREHARRGFPAYESPEGIAFTERKRGMWAGYFTRLENELKKKGSDMNIAKEIAARFGKPADPLIGKEGPIENMDDYTRGYIVGINALETQTGSHRIMTERAKREPIQPGTPESRAFEDWKHGYFVGIFCRLALDLEIHTGEKF